MTTKFLIVFDADAKVHICLPVDFIMTIAPQFKPSEIIEEADPMEGKTLIRNKSQTGTSTDHTMQEIADALNKFSDTVHVVRVDEGQRELQVIPPRRVITIPDGMGKVIQIAKE